MSDIIIALLKYLINKQQYLYIKIYVKMYYTFKYILYIYNFISYLLKMNLSLKGVIN